MKKFLVGEVGVEAVGLAVFPLAFAFFQQLPDRSFAPDIVWGEKPFELAFLNVVHRSEFSPPHDPWLVRDSTS